MQVLDDVYLFRVHWCAGILRSMFFCVLWAFFHFRSTSPGACPVPSNNPKQPTAIINKPLSRNRIEKLYRKRKKKADDFRIGHTRGSELAVGVGDCVR